MYLSTFPTILDSAPEGGKQDGVEAGDKPASTFEIQDWNSSPTTGWAEKEQIEAAWRITGDSLGSLDLG